MDLQLWQRCLKAVHLAVATLLLKLDLGVPGSPHLWSLACSEVPDGQLLPVALRCDPLLPSSVTAEDSPCNFLQVVLPRTMNLYIIRENPIYDFEGCLITAEC